MYVALGIADFLEMMGFGLVDQHRLGRTTEEIGDGQVDGSLAFLADETETFIARHLAHLVVRGTFALGGLFDDVLVFLVDQQTHTFLRLVADDFLVGQGRVANRQVVDINHATCVLDEFAKTVEVTACAVVVDAADRIMVALSHGTNDVAHALLHLGVGTLHGIQLDGVAVLACIHTRHGSTTHTNAVVVTAENDDNIAFFGFQLLGILYLGKANAARQHDDLVVAKRFFLFMFKGQQAAVDEGLAELVAKVRGSVRGLDEDLLRGLIEPLARLDVFLPLTALLRARIGSHVNSSSSQRQATLAAGQAVADFAATARGCAVERLHCGREVVRFGLQRNHRFDGLDLEG